jgi:anaphase-promoting complex subunit 1
MASVEKDYAKHAHILPTMPQVRFGSDKRLEEVERIMQTTRVRTIETKAPAGMRWVDSV